MALTNRFSEEVRTFGAVMQEAVTEPERVIMGELEVAVIGQLLPRLWQVTGSCVGVGGARAYSVAACGDIYFRKDWESLKLPSPWPTYGIGRDIAGMDGPGEGSFGAAQAEACKPTVFGILPWDDPRLPVPTYRSGWAQWTSQQEKQWSHPSVWPVSRSELEPDAKQFGLYTVTQIKQTSEITQALAQGYGITIASMFGTRGSRVQGDVAIAEYNDSWAHQMAIDAYWKHPTHGLIYWIQNSWGPSPSIHAPCPTMSEFGIEGGMWITESTLQRILDSRDSECFAHSATGGFPAQSFDWGNMGWVYG